MSKTAFTVYKKLYARLSLQHNITINMEHFTFDGQMSKFMMIQLLDIIDGSVQILLFLSLILSFSLTLSISLCLLFNYDFCDPYHHRSCIIAFTLTNKDEEEGVNW